MGADLQCAKYLAFPFQRRISRKVGAGAGAYLLRIFLERLGGGQNALHSRIRPKSLYRSLFEAGTDAGSMGLFASWPQLAKDFAQLSQTKLTVPVLSIGGEKSLGNELAAQMKLVATDVTVVVLKDTGHWILEERPKETTDALVKFL